MTGTPPAPHSELLPAQLCIGLYVHLDLPWTEHPFTFSSFKIKDLEQVAAIQALGLARIRYSPERSDGRPLDTPQNAPAPAPSSPPASEDPAYKSASASGWSAWPPIRPRWPPASGP